MATIRSEPQGGDSRDPDPVVEKTAGDQIAEAIRKFNGGSIDRRQLATAIDDALKAYR